MDNLTVSRGPNEKYSDEYNGLLQDVKLDHKVDQEETEDVFSRTFILQRNYHFDIEKQNCKISFLKNR